MVSVVISLFFCHNCTKEVDKAGLKKGRGGGGGVLSRATVKEFAFSRLTVILFRHG